MNIPRHALSPFALLLMVPPLIAGCSFGEQTLPKEVTSAIENAFASNDAATIAAQFEDDAELLQPNAGIIRGRQEIDAFWQEQVRPVLSYDMSTVESRVFGDYAYHYATYTFRNVRRGNIVETGKVIEIWHKVGGKWRVHLTSWSQDRPPPVPTVEADAKRD
jgi:ketosteroid isomerase-like protein